MRSWLDRKKQPTRFNVSELKRQPRTVTISVNGMAEPMEVTFRPAAPGSGPHIDPAAEPEVYLAQLDAGLSSVIADWNLESDAQPYPPTLENLRALAPDLKAKILGYYLAYVAMPASGPVQ